MINDNFNQLSWYLCDLLDKENQVRKYNIITKFVQKSHIKELVNDTKERMFLFLAMNLLICKAGQFIQGTQLLKWHLPLSYEM